MTEKIAVIGAGLSGLTVAKLLTLKGFIVDVFDKGRAVGGRMSCRRTEWGYLDHGTQYFTIDDPLFQEFLGDYSSIVIPWEGKFASWRDGNLTSIIPTKSRYVSITGMNNLCKKIAEGLNVYLPTRIIRLEKSTSWILVDNQDKKYSGYDKVIITAPPIQTLDLLQHHTPLTESIESLKMYPCYSLMIVPETKPHLTFDGIEFNHPILGWFAFNDSKPLRGDKGGMIIQSNFSWAQDNLDLEKDLIINILKDSIRDILSIDLSHNLYESLHLWRYAIPSQTNDRGYYLDKENNIGICGDWCLKGKVQSAFLSAYYLAESIN